MKNHRNPKRLPNFMCMNTTGRVLNPRSKDESMGKATPRNTKAAGIVMRPPRQTSKNSLIELAVSPESTTSSLRRR